MKRHTYVQVRRQKGGQPGGRAARWVGLALMVIGGLILVISVPIRFWFALFGLTLALAGFLLWQFA